MLTKYAIFDLDGTLVDSMSMWDRVTANLLAARGKAFLPGDRARTITLTVVGTAEFMVREYHLPDTTAALAQQIRAEAKRQYTTAVRLKPGVPELLAALQARGVEMCVASGSEKELVDAALGALGIAEYFRFTISCGDHCGKDQPEIYERAMRGLGAPEPAVVTVFEDSPVALATAKAAGFRVTAVRDLGNAGAWEQMKTAADSVCEDWETWLRQNQ